MRLIAILAIVVCECLHAQVNYNMMLTNMVTTLDRTNGTLEPAFMSQLQAYAGAATNAAHRANIDLVRAIALTDVAEDDLSGDVLLPQAVSLCSNIVVSTQLVENAWQKGAACIVLSGIYSFGGNRAAACRAITNDVAMAAYDIPLPEDAFLWGAVARHLCVEGLSVRDASRCYAAIAVVSNDPASSILSYTNDLPESVTIKIRGLVE